jgi:outer membrane receptor protein involved in Fe transport
LWLLPTAADAQGTSTANVAGVVRDTSGAVMSGVSVEAASPVLIERVRTAVTNERGEYRLSELPPGAYVVTFTGPGFATLKREGLELRTNFTAQVDVEMTLGQLQETVTVEGATPLVDVQSVTQQQTVSRELLDTAPTAKSVLGIAALIPAVVEPPNAQDVGGSKGERSVRITVHGGKTFDSRLLQDGMRYNALTPGIGSLEGTGRGYYVNPLAVQEVVVDLGTLGSAEYGLGGAQVNAIPKDGGNRFRGSLFAGGTTGSLQSNNLDDGLRNQGLTFVNTVKAVYDFNGAIGGPILKDRLWFFASARAWGTRTGVANLYADSGARPFLYTPDLTRPVEPVEKDRGAGVRLLYQATSKDKFSFSYDKQRNFQDQLTGQLETGTLKNEANAGYCQRQDLFQGAWNRAQSATLLFDAGVTVSRFNYGGFGNDLFLRDYQGCGGGLQDNVAITDVVLGYTYNGVGNRTMSLSHQSNGRFSVSKVEGRHNLKTGVFWMYGLGGGQRTYTTRSPTQVGGLPVSYTFANGVPVSLTEYTSPNLTVDQLNPDLGLFVQDQWRLLRNLTVNAGLRFDWVRESVGATSVPAGLLVPARSYPAISNVPNWKDLNPRFGIVWDPSRSGKTAIKFGINRYVSSNTTGIANLFDRAAAAVTSTTRSWNDNTFTAGDPRRGNFIPDCDLTNTAANGECGPMANPNFGTYVPVNTPDPKWITGWGKRPYSWQTSAGIDQQLLRNLVVNASFFRTWYGNFQVTDNLDVTPADYSPYCVTVPVDSRLPLSGQQLCGLYDLNPNKFGQINNLITRNNAYGRQTEIYNGVDVNFQLRLRQRASLGGGWNIGNAVQLGTTAGGSATAGTNNCYVIDSPQQLFNCKVNVPYQSRVKINGSYTFPYGIEVAAVAQSNPGANYSANRTFTLAEIQPSLGRALSGGVTTVVIPLVKPYSLFGPRISQIDLRVSKLLRFSDSRRVQLNMDFYNLFNSNTPVTIFGTYNARWGQPTQVLDGRLIKFSTQVDF